MEPPRKMNSDAYSMEITDGMKTIVCKLKDNPIRAKKVLVIPLTKGVFPNGLRTLPMMMLWKIQLLAKR